MMQAALLTPQGMLAISNGVAVLAGPNPAEVSLLPMLVPTPGAINPLDDGFALELPAPPGFAFYGVPTPLFHAATNGYLDFRQALPGVPPGDLEGDPGDLGCAPATGTASPRLAANHYDIDLSAAPPSGLVSELHDRTCASWTDVAVPNHHSMEGCRHLQSRGRSR